MAASLSETAEATSFNSTNLDGESDMAMVDDLTGLAKEVIQGSAYLKAEITNFPSGAGSLLIHTGDRAFELVYLPSYAMFGVDELEADAGFDSGYRFCFPDFASARTKLLDILEEARAAPACEK
jgi:hypothetical protein